MESFVTPLQDSVFERLVVVSPHFDDAVLGVGCLLAAHQPATVVTVIGGAKPGGYDTVTPWDALGGFQPGQDVAATRQAEDIAALGVLGARSTWLEFTDNQYDQPYAGADRPPVGEVADALEARLLELAPTAVVIPLGLANPDHVVTGEASLEVRRRHPDAWTWLGYAEAGYASIPGVLTMRLRDIVRGHGIWPTPAPIPGQDHTDAKRKAMAHYVSQVPPLVQDWGFDVQRSTQVPESLWRMDPLPPQWAGVSF
jgi:LmbE family N-acetylglucosaminyl deacetylase